MIFVPSSTETNILSPGLTMPPLSHLTSCTPTKSHLYLANSLAAVESDPDLYIPSTKSRDPLLLLRRISPGPRHMFHFRNKSSFYGEELLAHFAQPPEDHPSSAVRDCLFNIFTATHHIRGRSSIRYLRTNHAVVTGTHLSWL